MPDVIELAKATAIAFDRPEGEIRHYARRLREAEMLPTSVRGAKPMPISQSDTARLLIGVMGSDTATGAPDAVHNFADLTVSEFNVQHDEALKKDGKSLLAKFFRKTTTLLSAIETLLELGAQNKNWEPINLIEFTFPPEPRVFISTSPAISDKQNIDATIIRFSEQEEAAHRRPIRQSSVEWHVNRFGLRGIYDLIGYPKSSTGGQSDNA